MNLINLFKSTIIYLFLTFISNSLCIINITASTGTIMINNNNNNNNENQHRTLSDRNPYVKATDELLLDLRHQLLTRSLKFDEHFRNLLSNSKVSLHNMFVDTYGMMYEQNTEIFINMFESLEKYYAKGDVKLTYTMENFFQRLYQKIFQVFNRNYIFSANYLECATDQLAHLKPFRDIPEKVINGIKRSFVAARTFEQALNGGIDFIKGVISLGQPAVCTNLINDRLIKNTIGQNQNLLVRVPCLQFCEQVITRCIGRANLEPLDIKWRAYITDLVELAKILANNYNVETIITPLDVQISEAIMNFQENGYNISSKVFQECGKPPSSYDMLPQASLKPQTNRLVRRAAPFLLNPNRPYVPNINNNNSPMNFNNNHQYMSYGSSSINKKPLVNSDSNNNQNTRGFYSTNSQTTNLGSNLRVASFSRDGSSTYIRRGNTFSSDHDITSSINQKSPILVEEIKNYMLSIKSFWSTFPNSVCTSNHTLGSNITNSLRKQLNNNCFNEQLGMLDNNSDMRYRQEIVKLGSDLELIRSKIDDALEGREIDWTVVTKVPFNTDKNLPHRNIINNGERISPLIPMIMSTSSSTTTMPEQFSTDSEDQEEPDDDDTLGDYGSGVGEPSDDDENTPTDYNDDSETTESQNTSSTELPPEIDDINKFTQIPPMGNNDVDRELLTPDAQRSSQTSNKLVINNQSQILSFVSLIFVCTLLIVKNNYNLCIKFQQLNNHC